MPTLKYIQLTIKHKWFVFLAGVKIGTPVHLLILHDLSKFNLYKETIHYGRQFFGKKDDPLGFSQAWNHHQKTNKHHWEYWVLVSGHNRGGYKDLEPLPMPKGYVKEMVADWMGASKAYTGKYPDLNNWAWYRENFEKMNLHVITKFYITEIISKLKGKQ